MNHGRKHLTCKEQLFEFCYDQRRKHVGPERHVAQATIVLMNVTKTVTF